MLSRKLLPALISTMAPAINTTPYVDDVFSSYPYTGTGAPRIINNGVALGPVLGSVDQIMYDIPGTHYFVVPDGVYSISVALDGGGGGAGGSNFTYGYVGGSGGGAGSLFKNNIAVTPGDVILVVVGAGGAIGASSSTGSSGQAGTPSSILGLIANGGGGGYAGAAGGGGGGLGGKASGTGATLYTGANGGRGAGSLGGSISLPTTSNLTVDSGKGGDTGYANQQLPGNNGCVRIIWPGDVRQFPSTSTNDVTPVGRVNNDGMVWIKHRTGYVNSVICDSVRSSVNKSLSSSTTASEVTYPYGVVEFNKNGFTLGTDVTLSAVNAINNSYSSWTFRKASKFFDIVTFTGDGTSQRVIAHSLGIAPGMIIIKSLNTVEDWTVHHRFDGNSVKQLYLNSTAGISGTLISGITDTNFNVYKQSGFNSNTAGTQYVAYLFAHDVAEDGIIQCGSFTTNSSGAASVNLGWEPQFLMLKNCASTGDWIMLDQARVWVAAPGKDAASFSNIGGPESSTLDYGNPTASGFTVSKLAINTTYIYMAIRRSNKPPTKGTDVFCPMVRTGNNAVRTITGVGFPPDLVMIAYRPSTVTYTSVYDRLRGPENILLTYSTSIATLTPGRNITSFDSDGIKLSADSSVYSNFSNAAYLDLFFKRSVGVFDIVCFTGTNVARQEKHNLKTIPEMMIVKSVTNSTNPWLIYHKDVGPNYHMSFNTASNEVNPLVVSPVWNNLNPTELLINIGYLNGYINSGGSDYIMYLFSSKANVSKIGSYVGNGTNQVINCGFSTGARFIMISSPEAVMQWFVWDTARGIIAGNDPYLGLSVGAGGEVTTNDSIDPDLSGFIVNQVAASNINLAGRKYIFLAFA